MDLPEGTTPLAKKIVLAEALVAVVGIVGSPFPLFGVRERLCSKIYSLGRTTSLVAVFCISSFGSAEEQLAEFVLLNAWFTCGVLAFAVLAQAKQEPLTRPDFCRISPVAA